MVWKTASRYGRKLVRASRVENSSSNALLEQVFEDHHRKAHPIALALNPTPILTRPVLDKERKAR
jgi:hypothetical protein